MDQALGERVMTPEANPGPQTAQKEVTPSKDKKEDAAEVEALIMISSCISDMSNKYEQTCRNFQDKLEGLDKTSKHLNAKFEQL